MKYNYFPDFSLYRLSDENGLYQKWCHKEARGGTLRTWTETKITQKDFSVWEYETIEM